MAPSEYVLDGRLIQPKLNRIQYGGETIQVEPRVMDVLMVLVARAGEPVTREELFDAVWTDTIVTDDTLTRCIGELRKIFGDDARNPRVIETIPRVGYRLIRQPTTRDDGGSRREVSPKEVTARSPPRPSARTPSIFTAKPLWIGAVALIGLIAWQFLRPEGDGNEPPSPMPPGAAPLA